MVRPCLHCRAGLRLESMGLSTYHVGRASAGGSAVASGRVTEPTCVRACTCMCSM